jgi:hypothetical protein
VELENKELIATCSHLYNNVLAFASTGVDTAYSDGAEDEKWVSNVIIVTIVHVTAHDLTDDDAHPVAADVAATDFAAHSTTSIASTTSFGKSHLTPFIV